MKKEMVHWIEEALLLILIMLNILDFVELIPGDIDVSKKVISWIILGYLLYRVSLSRIFFGERHPTIDLMLILSYFCLITKNIVSSMMSNQDEVVIFKHVFDYIIRNAVLIEFWSFYTGGILIILLSLYIASNFNFLKKSIIGIIHEDGPVPRNFGKFAVRWLSVFILAVGFFVIIFNLMMEWLAIAVDASIVIFTIIFYIITVFQRHFRNFHPQTYIFKVGEGAENFYFRFIELFQSKEKIFLGLSGILVLHLLTDIGNFIVPYLTGIKDLLYFSQLGAGHTAIYTLVNAELASNSGFVVGWIYFFNAVAMILLLLAPAYIWYKIYRESGFKVSNFELGIFFTSVFVFIFSPAFKIQQITAKGLIGVDIITQKAVENSILHPVVVVIASMVILAAILIMERSHPVKSLLIVLMIACVDIFFACYIFHFFVNVTDYYLRAISVLLSSSEFLIVFYFFLFFAISVMLYIGGFIIFISETKREFKYIK